MPSPSVTRDLLGSTLIPTSGKCSKFNGNIRSSSELFSPNFDSAQYVKHGFYTICKQYIGGSEIAMLLHFGVYDFLKKNHPSVGTRHSFSIRTTSLQGDGMFCQQQIPAGDIILTERPTIIAPYTTALPNSMPKVLKRLIGQLSQPLYDEVLKLSTGGQFYSSDETKFECIMRVNSLLVNLASFDGKHSKLVTHRGVFLKTSRCNHSCGPNAKWTWDPASLALQLIATRNIQVDEEITISYMSVEQPRQKRQASLQSLYNFHCTCPHCDSPASSLITLQSDLSRQVLSQIWNSDLPSFKRWCIDLSYPDDALINVHIRALHLIRQERLEVLNLGPGVHPQLDIGRHVDRIAMCYGALENVKMFREWIRRARDMRGLRDQKQRLVFSIWLSNPTAFPIWGGRRLFYGVAAGDKPVFYFSFVGEGSSH